MQFRPYRFPGCICFWLSSEYGRHKIEVLGKAERKFCLSWRPLQHMCEYSEGSTESPSDCGANIVSRGDFTSQEEVSLVTAVCKCLQTLFEPSAEDIRLRLTMNVVRNCYVTCTY